MKRIVLFGAGKSATCLIDYLSSICNSRNWLLTIADANAGELKYKLGHLPAVHLVTCHVENTDERSPLIRPADLVISLLPPALHILIAGDCLRFEKNLLTASYADDAIKKLSQEISDKKLLFLCEMGLDPGIDHMSAMQIIHRIQATKGKITVFRSHTGGLVAPESDNNPWHYKISWNPANVVTAGSSGAVFLESGEIKNRSYSDLFENTGIVKIPEAGEYAWYPNRDSLAYIPVYGLESAHSFIRTTLRHPEFCFGWKNIVKAGLTDSGNILPSSVKTVAQWSEPILPFVNESNRYLYEQLGFFENDLLPGTGLSSAKILQHQLERFWKMSETDKDMIVMLHEFEYEHEGEIRQLRSSLVVMGENATRTAMAKTVGLPLGIAAVLILENKIRLHGLHIPIIPEIYEPVLVELRTQGIIFREYIS